MVPLRLDREEKINGRVAPVWVDRRPRPQQLSDHVAVSLLLRQGSQGGDRSQEIMVEPARKPKMAPNYMGNYGTVWENRL